jgi:rhamnosyl/mannosyltransferase
VHLHFPYPAGEIANLLVGRARRTIITYHSDIVRQRRILQVYAPLLRCVLSRADRIIATSEPYLRSSPFLQAVQDRCQVVPLGIDVARFAAPSRDAAAVRAVAGVAATAPVVLFVGVLRYYKGLDTLVSAMSLIPDAHLVIVGDGPMRDAIRSMTTEMGLTGRVTLTGQVDDATLEAWYSASDLFVLPSNVRAEAFGTAILEAMAAGLPVVSTEVGSGTSWVNQHGVTGTVVRPNSPSELAVAIRELIQDPARRRALGASGHARVRDTFSVQAMVDGVDAVYQQALGAPPVSRRA